MILMRLRALFHWHRWRPLKVNVYGITYERHCTCGKVEHTTWNAFNWDTCKTKWMEGPHP